MFPFFGSLVTSFWTEYTQEESLQGKRKKNVKLLLVKMTLYRNSRVAGVGWGGGAGGGAGRGKEAVETLS